MKINVKLTIGLALLLLLLIFIVQNAVVVELHFLFWTLSMSRSLIIIFSIVIGTVIGWLLSSFVHHARNKTHKTPPPQAETGDSEHKPT